MQGQGFQIGFETAESDQYADQTGKRQGGRGQADELKAYQLEYCAESEAAVDDEIGKPEQLGGQQQNGQAAKGEQGGAHQFPHHVPVQRSAHTPCQSPVIHTLQAGTDTGDGRFPAQNEGDDFFGRGQRSRFPGYAT